MGFTITHPKVLPGPDDDDPNTVSPTDWNIAHTLTGTADASQLNANVVQGVSNDTNITGSIALQTLTFAWSGTLALSRFAQGTDGQLIVGQTSAAPQYKTITGDVSITAAGAASVNALHSGALANPSATIGLTAVNGSATTALRSDGAPALSQAIAPTWTGSHTFSPASGNAITINPASASTARAINSTQTGPATTPSGPVIYNQINVTNPASVTSPSTLTNGMLDAESRGFHVEMVDSSSTTVAAALTAHMVANTGTPAGDKVALIANSYSNKNISGFVLGVDAVASSDVGTIASLVALQAETKIYGGTVTNRMGIDVDNYGSNRAGTFDTAISISNYGTAGGAYQAGISFGSPGSLAAALSSTGDAIYAQQAMSITNFANCANFTLTGSIPFNFGTTFQILSLNNQNSATQIGLANNNAGATTFIQYSASNGTNNMTAGIGGTGATPAIYTGRSYITGNGSDLIVGTGTNKATVLLANSLEIGRYTTGGLTIGPSFAAPVSANPQAPLTVSANVTAAPSQAVLTDTNLWIVGKDGAFNNGLTLDQYGGQANNPGDISIRQARGTAASPTASASGDTIGQFRMWGYTGSAFYRGAALFVTANETFSGTAGGCDLSWFTTPNTTHALAVNTTFKASGGLTVGTASNDAGAGGIIFSGQLYGPSIATTASAANAFIDTATTPAGQLKRSTSSLAYKRDVEALDPAIALDVLNQAKPIWYRSKCAGDNQEWSFYGLGAEDVAAFDPRLVNFGYQDRDFEEVEVSQVRDGETIKSTERRLKSDATVKPDSVQYERLVPHLIAGWKAHEAKIAELEVRIEALLGRKPS